MQIVILEDHLIFAEGVANLLTHYYKDALINIESKPEQVLKLIKEKKCDILISDILIPNYNIAFFIRECKSIYTKLPIIIMTSLDDLIILKEYMEYGVNAFLTKKVRGYEIQAAIEHIKEGQQYLSSDMSNKLLKNTLKRDESILTKREQEMVQMVSLGLSIVEIADKLNISPHTVANHRSNIMRKLNLRSALEIVKYAYDNKII